MSASASPSSPTATRPSSSQRRQGAAEVRRPADGHARGRAGRGPPGHRRHADRPAQGQQHAVRAERRHRAQDGAEVAGVGDAVEGDEQRLDLLQVGALARLLEQVVGVEVVERRHREREALVHGAVGHPVDVAARHLHHRDPALGGAADRLADAVVDVDVLGDVERDGGAVRAQALDHRVAPEHGLGAVGVVTARRGTARRGALLAGARRRGARDAEASTRASPAVGLVVGALLGGRGRALALEAACGPCRRSPWSGPSSSPGCGGRRGGGSCRPWVSGTVLE